MLGDVTMKLGPGEPPAGPWRVEPIGWVTDTFAAAHLSVDDGPERPYVIAIDGRSASGKTTLAAALSSHVPRSVVLHTDDIAWHHSFFGWGDLMREGVLEPLHRGESVSYRPPAWDARDRAGAITVPAGCPAVFVEGVSAARRELMPWIDAVVWVQSDRDRAEELGISRDGGDQAAREFWAEWMAQEDQFLAEDLPWERADVVAAGNGVAVAHDPKCEIVVAPPLGD